MGTENSHAILLMYITYLFSSTPLYTPTEDVNKRKQGACKKQRSEKLLKLYYNFSPKSYVITLSNLDRERKNKVAVIVTTLNAKL